MGKFLHVRNLDKYQPGYKDRKHIWAKIYIDMIQGDHETELLSEISFARLVKFIVLETYTQKFVPLSVHYLSRKGFDFGVSSLEETVQELSHFIEIIDVTENEESCNENRGNLLPRVDKSREDKEARTESGTRFKKPVFNELKLAFETGGLETSLAEREARAFLDYYDTVGWVIGRTRKPMKSWRGAVSNWLRNRANGYTGAEKPGGSAGAQKPENDAWNKPFPVS